MSKNIRLSHSSMEKYKQCPRKWELHYIERLRPITTSSALFFGRAIDEAVNALLLQKKKKLSTEEQDTLKKHPMNIFYEFMAPFEQDVNAQYFNSDLDISLLEKHDYGAIFQIAAKQGEMLLSEENVVDFVKEIQGFIKKRQSIEDSTKVVYNFICHRSLIQKGERIIEAYEKEIMPKIHEVIDIQKTIELPNEDGDYITGNIDFIATFVDDPEKVYIIDNKTSSKAYPDNCFEDAAQLAIYCEAMENNLASYIVMEKSIRKREPQVRVNIHKGEISDELFEKTFDKAEEILYNIREKNFSGKANRKECFFFGRNCEYFKKCWNNSEEGLIKKE